MRKLPLISLLFSISIVPNLTNAASAPNINENRILQNATNLSPVALKYALKGYDFALKRGAVRDPNILTVVDFSLPSNAKRLWVIDLKDSRVLMNLYTTHGKGSGLNYASRFSNTGRTDASSLGVYELFEPYRGKHGYSERVKGLEAGINSNAYSRAIVVHPAWYATQDFIKKNNRAGRSWGCFGIDPSKSTQFVNLTKNGSVMFVYAQQEKSDSYLR